MWELKCKKIHVTVLVLVYSSQKNVSIIYANVPFVATQARIMYRQFLYIAGTGVADAQARITWY